MQHSLARSRSAVVIRHWFEIDLDDASMEHGARIEIRELPAQPHRGSESASQLTVVDRVSVLKARALRVLELEFAEPVQATPFRSVPGVREVTAHRTFLHCEVVGPVGDLMRVAAGKGLVNVVSHEPDLEQIFLSYMQGGVQHAA